MNTVFVTFCLAVVALVNCEPPSSYGAPSQTYGAPAGGYGGGDKYENNEPQAYEFGYRVKDDYTGSNFNQKESSDGNQVKGEYRVALPDGRTQIVTYYADWQTGFHADVRYEGQATYPPTKPQYGAPSIGKMGGGGGYGYPSPSTQYGAPH